MKKMKRSGYCFGQLLKPTNPPPKKCKVKLGEREPLVPEGRFP